MTLITIPKEKLPSTTPFLNSVCPGFNQLDDNIHFTLQEEQSDLPTGLLKFNWPITNTRNNLIAKLDDNYLNISRPPFTNNNESTTYVNLPYHITNLFKRVVEHNDKSKDGDIHIGSNVNPLIHDPFKFTNLNPGCISRIIQLENDLDEEDDVEDPIKNKHKLNKFASNFNRLLNLKRTTHQQNQLVYKSLLSEKPSIIEKILIFDEDKYQSEIKSSTTHKLLISTHVNILNIFALDQNSNYKNTKSFISEKPIVYFPDDSPDTQQQQQQPHNPHQQPHPIAKSMSTQHLRQSTTPTPSATFEKYQKVIEEPILRIQFRQTSIITSVTTFMTQLQPHLLLGLDTGEIILIKLFELTYQIFDNLGINDNDIIINNSAVTTMEIIHHPNYEYLIMVGFSNGEVMIIDPNASESSNINVSLDEKISKRATSPTPQPKYTKQIVGKDSFVTYFKKFDLSPLSTSPSSPTKKTTQTSHIYYPPYLVGHFKLSQKPITAITSTLQNNPHHHHHHHNNPHHHSELLPPLILAIAADDGLVRIFDLLFTYGYNYANDDPNCNTVVTDILSNYFNDGIYDVEFSPDYKFLCIVGKGDLIEIFKMNYYNMNGLLAKNAAGINTGPTSHHNLPSTSNIDSITGRGAGGRSRSRSGTVNSMNSGNNGFSLGMLLSPTPADPNNRPDPSSTAALPGPKKDQYPPMIKDIQIIGRFKGHSNTVKSIQFVKQDDSSNLLGVVYKLISCGNDSKIIIWEFDYKALPKVKKPKPVITTTMGTMGRRDSSRRRSFYDRKKHMLVGHTPSPATRRAGSVTGAGGGAAGAGAGTASRRLSVAAADEVHSTSLTNLNHSTSMNMASILTINDSGSEINHTPKQNTSDQIEIVLSLYKSLFDIRTKRHYKRLGKKQGPKYKTIISPIVDDKLVPLIDIPLCVVDFSRFVNNGKIDSVYFDDVTFWCFAKNGDIFRYSIC